jgi:hypothetical protein
MVTPNFRTSGPQKRTQAGARRHKSRSTVLSKAYGGTEQGWPKEQKEK